MNFLKDKPKDPDKKYLNIGLREKDEDGNVRGPTQIIEEFLGESGEPVTEFAFKMGYINKALSGDSLGLESLKYILLQAFFGGIYYAENYKYEYKHKTHDELVEEFNKLTEEQKDVIFPDRETKRDYVG